MPRQFIGILAVNAAAIKPLFSQSKWMKTTLMRSKDGLGSSQSGGSRSAARAYFSFRRGTGTGHDSGHGDASGRYGPYAATAAAASFTHSMSAFGGGHWSSKGGRRDKGGGELTRTASQNSSEEMIVPPGFEVTEIIPDVERGLGAAEPMADDHKPPHQHQQQQTRRHGGRQSIGGGIMVTTTYHVE